MDIHSFDGKTASTRPRSIKTCLGSIRWMTPLTISPDLPAYSSKIALWFRLMKPLEYNLLGSLCGNTAGILRRGFHHDQFAKFHIGFNFPGINQGYFLFNVRRFGDNSFFPPTPLPGRCCG